MGSPLTSFVAAPALWYAVAAAVAGYVVYTIVYNRFFHPLAKVPGPWLASVSFLYQSYYNRVFYKQIDLLHKKYGPVVRITPEEVHLSDPENLEKIYSMAAKFPKNGRMYNALNVPFGTFGTVSNDVHKHKRSMLNPFFSRRTVLQLEDVVQDKAEKLVRVMQQAINENKPADLHHAFRGVSIDVVSDYAFGECYNLLDDDDLGAETFRLVRAIGPSFYIFQQFPRLQPLALATPPWLAPYFNYALGEVLRLQQNCVRQIEEVRSRMQDGKLSRRDKEGRPTIFTQLLDPEKQDGWPVPSTWELKDEAFSVLVAAADTTGNAMTISAYNVIHNPDIYQKLRAELIQAFPDQDTNLPFVELERLPYLTGVIKEGLRLSFGVPGRLSRTVPAGGATFNGHFIPEGCCVGMSSWTNHRNPDVFPEPMRFDPDRWTDPVRFREADRSMNPFGRGPRQCVGMPLAYAELYVTIGSLFRKFDGLRVYKTTAVDLEYEDYFSGYHIYGRNWFKAVGPDYESGDD